MTPDPHGPLILRPSRRRWFRVLAIGLLFSGGFGAMLWTEPFSWMACFFLGFFALATLAAAVQLLTRKSQLVLDRDGFTIQQFGRAHRVRWRDVAGPFRLYGTSGGNRVGFDLAGPDGTRYLAELSKNLAGVHGGLPDTYGLSAEELAHLMNEWRERALSRLSGDELERFQAKRAPEPG